jgi:Resolvase, N terminal domain
MLPRSPAGVVGGRGGPGGSPLNSPAAGAAPRRRRAGTTLASLTAGPASRRAPAPARHPLCPDCRVGCSAHASVGGPLHRHGHCITRRGLATAHGRLMLTVLGGLAEFERELIRSRTSEGRERAKAKGVVMGRKPKLTSARKPLRAGMPARPW